MLETALQKSLILLERGQQGEIPAVLTPLCIWKPEFVQKGTNTFEILWHTDRKEDLCWRKERERRTVCVQLHS